MASDEFTGGLTGELERAGGARVYRLAGEADVSGADRLRARLLELLEQDAGDLVLDLAGVAFMDTSALAALLAASFAARRTGRRLIVQGPSPPVLELIELTGVEGVLEIRPRPPAGG